jgi:8-oxo-dGTP pyrophosphatase MutT (NUDIX family)
MSVITLNAGPLHQSRYLLKPTISPYNSTFRGAGSVCIYTFVNDTIYILLGLEQNGEYNIALGKRESNETFVAAAARELNEEMHIKITPEALQTYPCCIDVQRINNVIHNVIMIYFVHLPIFIPGDCFTKFVNPDDHLTMLDYRWVPLDLLSNASSKWLTLDSGETIKLRRCLRSFMKIIKKKDLVKQFHKMKDGSPDPISSIRSFGSTV